MSRRTWAAAAALFALCLTPPAAHGLIKRPPALRDMLATEQLIFVAKVEKLLPDKPAVILAAGDALKGKPEFSRLPINLAGDAEGKKEKHPDAMLKRLAVGSEVVVFASKLGPRYVAFGFTNGTWFQMIGEGDKPADVKWLFLHCEPYFRRAFKGTTDELKQAAADGLAGKKAPPKPDEKEPPGLGPELKPDDKPTDPPAPKGGPGSLPFGVIPTVVLIGPLAILAALFPTVFGGLALMMKRWTAALSVSCLVSTVYFLQMYFVGSLSGTWLGTPTGLWAALAALAALGAVWAGMRYRRALRDADFDTFQPRKWDYLALVVLSVLCAGGVGYAAATGRPLLRTPWLDLLVSCAPIWVATAALVFVRSGPEGTSAFSLESAFLWGLVFVCGAAAALERGRGEGSGVQVATTGGPRMPRPIGTAWTFEPDGRGSIYSTPLIAGDRVYFSAVQGGAGQYGTVFCLDVTTGKEVWRFSDDFAMKKAFCSPVLADGKLYVGEGLHEDRDCKMYCLDAATGKKVWEFTTTSHTESSACVVNGKVYFGAGDDGVYCLNSADGAKVWNYPEVHVDANPVVENGRLYVGSGKGDKFNVTVLFCLDAEKGTQIWRVPVEQAAFAPPLLAGGHVYFGLGNGNFAYSDPGPVGSLLCVDAATGRRLWERPVGDAVLCKPAADADAVYITSRDGHCYSLSRADGRVRWKQNLGSAIVASPVLVGDEGEFATVRSVYVGTTEGRVACLNADNGEPFWSRDLSKLTRMPSTAVYATPAVEVRTDGGVERRRVVVALEASNDLTSLSRVYCFDEEVK